MLSSRQLFICMVAVCSVAAFSSQATAESQWQQSHPRRTEVNQRLSNQDQRINKEVKEGEISKSQAHSLHQEDHQIRQEEQTMAHTDNGHITQADQHALNQQENAVSKQIGH